MDRDEYVKIAKNWSANIEMLNGLRQVLRRKMIDSPLMDAKEFVGDLERRLRDIWLNHQ
jgi:predicted O-linked N-acetylglucosamine transferase (SPINDLY family)